MQIVPFPVARGSSVPGSPGAPVVGVLGGSGGVGASSLAAVLGWTAADLHGTSTLIDTDGASGGIDVLLGLEAEPGARWSGLRLDGGYLDPDLLAGGLPSVGGCAVLAADDGPPDAAAVAEVVAAGAARGPVVIDLARDAGSSGPRLPGLCDLVVLLARGDAPGLVAARSVAAGLPPVPVGLVVRRGDVVAADAAALVGVPLLAELPVLAASVPVLDPTRPPAGLAALARGILRGLGIAGSPTDADVGYAHSGDAP